MAESEQPFFRSLLQSMAPSGYRELRHVDLRHAFIYLILLVLLSLLVKALFAIPLFIDVEKSMINTSSKFNKASVQGALETSEVVSIPEVDPIIQIDTSSEAKKEGFALITAESITYGEKGDEATIPFPDFSDPNDRDEVTRWVIVLAALIAPAIVILLFMAGLVKAALLAIIMATLAFSLGSYRKVKQSYSSILALALHATTAMVLIEAIMVPLRLGNYLFPLFTSLGMQFYSVSMSLALCIFLIWFVILGSDKYAFGG